MKFLLSPLALIVATLKGTSAITFGEPDNNDHPHVGTLLFVQNGDGYYSCSGTLLSKTVMLTAGHCVEGGGNVNEETWVRFDKDALEGYAGSKSTEQWLRSKWIKAKEVIPHPNYNDYAGFPYTYDVGLVILNNPGIDMDTYGTLPTQGFLEGISNGNNAGNVFTNVGYGVQGVINPFYADDYSRMKSFAELKNIENANTAGGDASAMYSNNPGGGSGGTCYGDSGGPQFHQDNNTIVSITSWGITPCIGNDYSFRIDTADALDFINEHL